MTSTIDQLKLIADALQVDIHDCPADKSLGEWLASLVNRERLVVVLREERLQECLVRDLKKGEVFYLDKRLFVVKELPTDLEEEPYSIEADYIVDDSSNFHQVS